MPRVHDRFELLELLSDGSIAKVWSAFDHDLQCRVALKMLVPGPQPERRARFIREARNLRRVNSDLVVEVYEVFVEHEPPFFVMPFVEGRSLAEHIRERRAVPWDQATVWLRQVCEGLAAAHAAGIVHRDLKASNVHVEETTTRAILIDFGVAWDDDGRDFHTKLGVAVGTPAYFAPEVLAGAAPAPTQDVYAFAVLAHEMLTGTLPALARDGRPERLDRLQRAVEAGVTERFAQVIDRALAPDPGGRYPDAGALLQALDDALAPDPARLPAGTYVDDRYRIEERIGEGGIAVVYRAHDMRMRRDVALKVLDVPLDVGDDDVAELVGRFRDEHEVLMRLADPHVVPILGTGTWRGIPYGVLELVRGTTLSSALERLPWTDFIAVLREIAGALDRVHARGIVHRDVKPDNIMLRDGGGAVLIDFGFARLGSRWRTRTGYVIGTPGAEAPEQIAGADVDGSADQWALAAIAYRKLAGRRPGESEPGHESSEARMQLLENVEAGAILPLSTLRPDLEETVHAVVMRGLAKLPADRYLTVTDFVAALDGSTASLRRAPKRRRVALVLGSATLFVLGALVLRVLSASSATNRPLPNVTTPTGRVGKAPTVSAEVDDDVPAEAPTVVSTERREPPPDVVESASVTVEPARPLVRVARPPSSRELVRSPPSPREEAQPPDPVAPVDELRQMQVEFERQYREAHREMREMEEEMQREMQRLRRPGS